MNWLIYGANGYTGGLIAREAARRGWTPILAGRNAAAIEALGRELSLPTRVFSLSDPDQVAAGLKGVEAVLHCAGPFVHTAAPMVAACLRAHVHYLDITGEIAVFEALAARDPEARAAGIVLLPGAGFDVVPTDCLAAKLAQAMPDATDLDLAFTSSRAGLSRGTLKSGIENFRNRGAIRRDGQIVPVPLAYHAQAIEFGCGRRWAMTIPWGDVSTAYRTTGIPNIRVYIGLPRRVIRTIRNLAPALRLGTWPPVKRLARWWVARAVAGPGPELREKGRAFVWGRAANAAGDSVTATLETPEGYTLTALAALASVERVRSGEIPPGNWTPARAFGTQFVESLPGVGAISMQA